MGEGWWTGARIRERTPHDAVSSPFGPCLRPFRVSAGSCPYPGAQRRLTGSGAPQELAGRAAASRWTGRYSPAGSMKNSRSQSVTPRACCNRRWVRTEGLRPPCISWERYPAEIPLRRASSFWDMPNWSSSSHTETGLSFTMDREGRFRLISPDSAPVRFRSFRRREHGRFDIGAGPSTTTTPDLPRGNRTAALPVRVCVPFSFHPRPSAMRAGSSVALGPWDLSYGGWQVY